MNDPAMLLVTSIISAISVMKKDKPIRTLTIKNTINIVPQSGFLR